MPHHTDIQHWPLPRAFFGQCVSRQERGKMGQLLAIGRIAAQGFRITVREVEYRVGAVTGCFRCGGKSGPWAKKPLARARALDLKIGNTKRVTDRRPDQIRCLVVVVIRHPRPPCFCGRGLQQQINFRLGALHQLGLMGLVAPFVIKTQFGNKLHPVPGILKGLHQGTRHGAIAGRDRVVRGL